MKNGKMKFVYAIGDAPCRACDIGDMLDTIEDYYPAADVVPVRHGRWNRDKDGLVWCCLCGFGQERSEDRSYAYCPNCGARMDGDGDV